LVLACTALPAAIREYTENRPKVVIRVHDVAVDTIVDAVASGDVDLAVGPDRVTGSNVASEVAFDSRWVLWCSPTHPVASKKVIRWDELRDISLVAAGRDHERSVAQMLVNAPSDSRVTPVHVVNNVTTALGIAAQGLAATLAPAYVSVVAAALIDDTRAAAMDACPDAAAGGLLGVTNAPPGELAGGKAVMPGSGWVS